MLSQKHRLLLARVPRLVRHASRQSSAGKPGRIKGRGTGRPNDFWTKWSQHSQQTFYQKVGLEQDKQYEKRMGPLKAQVDDVEEERDEYDDDIFHFGGLGDGMEEDEYEDELVGKYGDANASESSASEAESSGSVVSAIRERVYVDQDVDGARRAELLELLEEVGPETFSRPPPPRARANKNPLGEEFSDITMKREAQLRTLWQVPSLMDTELIRKQGKLKPGQLFAYALHTRLVTKVGAEGKRRSYSVLAVVGNGAGSAGFGMGKDLEAASALYKATQAARKNMTYVERFDGRTLFHEMKEKYSANRLVITLRKANSGTRCNWTLWKILSAFGISDVAVKVHGSRNKMGMTHAMFNALQRMQTAQSTADRRGLRVLDMTPRNPVAHTFIGESGESTVVSTAGDFVHPGRIRGPHPGQRPQQ